MWELGNLNYFADCHKKEKNVWDESTRDSALNTMKQVQLS